MNNSYLFICTVHAPQTQCTSGLRGFFFKRCNVKLRMYRSGSAINTTLGFTKNWGQTPIKLDARSIQALATLCLYQIHPFHIANAGKNCNICERQGLQKVGYIGDMASTIVRDGQLRQAQAVANTHLKEIHDAWNHHFGG